MDACFCFKKHTFHFCHIIAYIPIVVERFLSRYANSFFKPISDKRITPRYVKMKILPLPCNIHMNNP